MSSRFASGAALLLAAILPTAARAQIVLYVDHDAAGSGDGSSWASAFVSLQDALTAAVPGDEIWVAEGMYRPDGRAPGDRSATFRLRSGVRLYGGFSGDETSLTDRRIDEHPTILSGDLAADDSLRWTHRDDNVYHVVTAVDVDSTALLDGFFVTGGYAVDARPETEAGVADSVGAGVLLVDAGAVLENVTLVGNRAYAGGGLYSRGGTPTIANAVFTGNRARRGGGVFVDGSDAWLTNATIANNFAETGAGLYNRASSPVVTNSILSGNGPPGDPASKYDCERRGYPCTYAEVSLRTRTRTRALADSVRDLETADDKIAWLRGQPDIEEAGGHEGSLRYRVIGGRANWILSADASFLGGAGKRDAVRGAAAPADVAGRDRNGDGKVNNRDGKRALILDPFNSLWGEYSDGQTTHDELVRTSGYDALSPGQVTWLRNADVTPSAFARWDQFDVVHVSTHGSTTCDPPLEPGGEYYCDTVLSTGQQLPDLAVYPEDVFAPESVTVEFRDANGRVLQTRYFLGLTRDWFAMTYDVYGPLDRTLVFLNACETYSLQNSDGSPTGSPDLLWPIFKSGTSAGLLVWTHAVPVVGAHESGVALYTEMLRNGRTLGDAIDGIRSAGLGRYLNSDAVVSELEPIGSQTLRAREVVFLLAESKSEALLQDGGSLVPYMHGTAGDGRSDSLELHVKIDGVEDGELDRYRFRFLVDDAQVGGRFTSSDATEQYTVGESSFSHGFDLILPLGRDVPSSTDLDIEVVAELPDDGGESRYEATLNSGDCYWQLTMGGTRAGTYSGHDVIYYATETGLNFAIGQISSGDPGLFINTTVSIPPWTTGAFQLGAGSVGDGYSSISFSVTEPPFVYETGDGSELKDPEGNVLFVRPGPAQLNLGRYDAEALEGRVTGQYYAVTNLEGTTFETATVSLVFRGEPVILPDGTINNDACSGG